MKDETLKQRLARLKKECFSEKLITQGESAQRLGKVISSTLHSTKLKKNPERLIMQGESAQRLGKIINTFTKKNNNNNLNSKFAVS